MSLKMILGLCSGSFLFLTSTLLAQDLSSLDYETGRAIFEKIWVSSPASTTASDGLGPLYNARSCNQCHEKAGRGLVEKSLVLKTDDEHFGQQIQTYAIVGLTAEAKVTISQTERMITLVDGEEVVLKAPHYSISDLEFGEKSPINYSPRIASSLAGLGKVELIPVELITALEDEADSNNDGISGRANWLEDEEKGASQLGRFGWKAGQASLADQNAKALNLDIGISSSRYPYSYGDCTSLQQDCLSQMNGNSPQHDGFEASNVMMDTLLFYTQNVPIPVHVDNSGAQTPKKGEVLFNEAGCSACHHPLFTFSNQQIRPYSDFLLHDMGEALADGFVEGIATGNEWRTPALWGLGRLGEAVYLHDGRAKNLQEAILWHGGEAKSATDRYKSMAKADRDDLIRFLNSL